MGRFDFDKHGYNPNQVDKYINNLTLKYEEKLAEQKDRLVSLKTELDIANASLNEYRDKDKQISRALVMAVEKAEQIEEASKRIYGLEIKRVRILYNRWEVLLEEIENRYPNLATTGKTKILLKDFKQSIEEVLRQNSKFTSVRDDIKATTDDTYIRNILNRMDYVEEKVEEVAKEEKKRRRVIQDVEMKVVSKPKKSTVSVKPTQKLNEEVIIKRVEKPKLEVKPEKKTYQKVDINDLIDVHKKENDRLVKFNLPKFDNMGNTIDKYMSDFDDNNAYAKIISSPKRKKKQELFEFAFPEPNETGYDYKDALHPKEELDEIMKAFDFYNPNEEYKG